MRTIIANPSVNVYCTSTHTADGLFTWVVTGARCIFLTLPESS